MPKTKNPDVLLDPPAGIVDRVQLAKDRMIEAEQDPTPDTDVGPDIVMTDWVPIEAIESSQPNHRLDDPQPEIELLAASMKERGLIQPIRVCPQRVEGKPIYSLVFGHRRLAAAKLLGWHRIRAEVVPISSAGEIASDRATENIHRRELNAMEEILAVTQAVEHLHGNTKRAALHLGWQEKDVRDRLMIGTYLCEKVRSLAIAANLKITHLRELAKLRDPDEQERICKYLVVDTEYDSDGRELPVYRVPPVEIVAQAVRRNFHDLAKVGWRLEVPVANKRPCIGCPSNTSESPDLFGETGSHCTDVKCFMVKQGEFQASVKAAASLLSKSKNSKPKPKEIEATVEAFMDDAEEGAAASLDPDARTEGGSVF